MSRMMCLAQSRYDFDISPNPFESLIDAKLKAFQKIKIHARNSK